MVLKLNQQKDKYTSQEKALIQTNRILEKKKFDFVLGTYTDDDEVQKFYYEFELRLRLQEAGFKHIQISKVLYPWGKNISGYEDFPGRPLMWDWFVDAEK